MGDGPQRVALEAGSPATRFTGCRDNGCWPSQAGANASVFLSRPDTFKLVPLEALAYGTPITAYPVTGPLEVVGEVPEPVCALDEDLYAACLETLGASHAACRQHAERWSWASCAAIFRDALVLVAAGARSTPFAYSDRGGRRCHGAGHGHVNSLVATAP